LENKNKICIWKQENIIFWINFIL